MNRPAGAPERERADLPMVDAAMNVLVNGVETAVPLAAATLADLVAALGLAGKRIAVEMNGAIVPRSRYGSTLVARGDRLEIVGAVGGG
jgi:sulfur carrier protein